MGTYMNLYKEKLTTPEKAVQLVKSNDLVRYGHFIMAPPALDEALSKRVGEMTNVTVKGICPMFPVKVALADPDRSTFFYVSAHLSAFDRHLGDKGLCHYSPANYGLSPYMLERGTMARPNVVMTMTTPMDENGYFNLGTANSYTLDLALKADYVVVEVNENVPRCLGGVKESIHISDVTCIVENNSPLFATPEDFPVSDEETKIARLLVERIKNGSCLQFGIGGLPNTIGKLLVQSGLKDLGIHSEMMADCYVDLVDKGIVTGRKKNVDTGKIVYTFAIGSNKMYKFMDNNPTLASYPVNITNSPEYIGLNDNVVAINNAVNVDLYGQIASESEGFRQISGVGGQLDFTIGATRSKGGESYICITSTKKLKDKTASRLVPILSPGTIVSVPRHCASNIVTEYGIVCMEGISTYERAERLISIAHPDFKDELVKHATDMGIWSRSNKIL
ncbi:MAG: butyryl-CoA:acetate CoA-transferase [Syntrophomonadaceae bacterium]|nr:butyryl-CoA:acetate CoA-transferase [Syntrophomonadaceae bacterium]